MEVTRQAGRGRSSRSRNDASNKENICPLQGAVSNAAEVARRRSPLPEGFPRSPLQDITHIICPHNIWPLNEDPLTDQVRKKFRKDNSAGSCITNDSDSNPSWKGLAPCVNVKSGTKVVQIEVEAKEKKNSKQSTYMDAVAISDEANINKHGQGLCIHRDEVSCGAISDEANISKHDQGLCIHRDEVPCGAISDETNISKHDQGLRILREEVPCGSISLTSCEVEGGQDAKFEEQSNEMGALAAEAHTIQHNRISPLECCNDLKQSISNRPVQTIAGKVNQTKRHQLAQSKKKSSVSMFR